jgi:hypothetical protein
VDKNHATMELLAYNQKIALAKLEEAKALERTRELEYQKESFQIQWATFMLQEQQKNDHQMPSM